MESFKIKNLSFTYPNREKAALCDINLTVSQGEFVTVCGKSGCGKTTLLRHLKPSLAPAGVLDGNIFFNGELLSEVGAREQAAQIGFVMQSPDNQIVTDKVWHELAFGLESLGYSVPEIRVRVSETASFFGIQTWFDKKVTELSGGQKQILNLASVIAMQPSVIILDEPTSQLDPIAAQDFLKILEKINRELGTTVILSEHRLDDTFPISDRVIVMDNGKIIADDIPKRVAETLKESGHDMYLALPAPMRIYGAVKNTLDCPLTVRDGRLWLERYSKDNFINELLIPETKQAMEREVVIEIKDAWFRYEKNLPDVIRGLNLQVQKGELFAIVGGNATGKTTAISIFSGLNKVYRGKVLINGEDVSKIQNLHSDILGVLPQNPQTMFVKNTVWLDLLEMLDEKKLSKAEKEERIKSIAALCRIDDLLESHPYDLSGGEQQRAALAKILLGSPKILLLDEPTKGMDAQFKTIFADILRDLKTSGVTIVMVSHDIEFCAESADRCALFFNGNITSVGSPREFFAGKNFYTTTANRMARTIIPKAILAEDVILACGGEIQKNECTKYDKMTLNDTEIKVKKQSTPLKKKKIAPIRIVLGCIFAVLFILTEAPLVTDIDMLNLYAIKAIDANILQIISICEVSIALACFIPRREFNIQQNQKHLRSRKLTMRRIIATTFMLIAIPLTIYVGVFYLKDRNYYFISTLIILEIMIPFCIQFEGKNPRARELVVISVLCTIVAVGRGAFFMLPQFKPAIALIIITGVCFGGETGFLVGAVSGFVSNFFFGQGPWTPWQMVAFGMIGFVAGVLFNKELLRKTKATLCLFGGVATLIIYGGIMNPASVILWQANPTVEMIISSYIMGFPFDLVHAVSTAFFLWFISEPMIEKIERVKSKY